MTTIINEAFMKFSKRAETNDPAKLVATFVNVGPLFTLLSIRDHQVVYGRRGTGKTHALTYLAETKRNEGHATVLIDMRTLGSTGGLYNDSSIPITQRATRLLADTLGAIHEALLTFFVNNAELYDLSQTGPILDRIADTISEVQVVGNIEREQTITGTSEREQSDKAEITIDPSKAQATIGGSSVSKEQHQSGLKTKESGVITHRVHFGSLGRDFADISRILVNKRVWILLDEWSSVPLDLQPYLADFLRRAIFPVNNFTIKIAAIEQRSRFRLLTSGRDYIGVELGADIAADLNLDDFMVFDNDSERAIIFFQEFLFKHYREIEEVDLRVAPGTSAELIQQAFTQRETFAEFVRATEGVPRDAMWILSMAAQKALANRISMVHVRSAARTWYQRDKESAARSNTEAHALLQWVIDQVIGERRARAFLLKNDTISDLVEDLFDARVLHVLKKNVSSRDNPGVRYDVYKLDYGCYVDLASTERAPLGLIIDVDDQDDEVYVDVPKDDYRAIRRAILTIEDFYKRQLRLLP